jgi:diguanylate cyclase (GGDEF)-like protein
LLTPWFAVAQPVTLPASDKPLRHYTYLHWTMADGLPQISVQALEQDAKGYLWVGTQAGLVRFDGHRFVAFGEAPGQLPDERILDLHMVNEHLLLVATQNGLSALDTRDSDASNMRIVLHGERVGKIVPDDNGHVLIAANGLPRIALDGNIEHLLDPETPIRSVARHDDVVWAVSNGELIRVQDGETKRVPLPEPQRHDTMIGIEWWQNALWIATSGHLYRFVDGAFEHHQLPPLGPQSDSPAINMLKADSQLWVGTYPALLRRNSLGQWDALDRGRFGAPPWPADILRDREGHLWIGSQSQALARGRFGWTYRYDHESGLGDDFVWSVEQGPDGLPWMGTNRGVSRYRNDRFETVLLPEQLPHPAVYSLYLDRQARMWLGTNAGLAIVVDDALVLPPVPDALARAQVRSFLQTDDEQILIGSSNGLYEFRDGEITPHRDQTLATQPIRSLAWLDNTLWVGTDRGLHFYGANAQKHDIPAVLQTAVITNILALDADHFLVATYRAGLHLYHVEKGWRAFSDDELMVNTAFAMLRDQRGRVWLSSHIGLLQTTVSELLDSASSIKQRMVISSGGQHAGAISLRCCNGAGSGKALLQQGRIWLPTLEGVIAVDTAQVMDNPQLATVVIEELQLRDGSTIASDDALDLAAQQRSFRLRYTALSYRDPAGVRFRYRLLGFDEDWVEAGSERFASYTNLAPGDYVFEVTAANDSGIWNPAPKTMRISIQAYWWEQPLVHGLAILALFILLWHWASWRSRRAAAIRQRLQAHVEARTRDLADANKRLDELNQQLAERSETDSLTGLRNRRFAMRQIAHECDFQARKTGLGDSTKPETPAMTFVLLDFDHFKDINDSLGHAAGDQVLIEFAQRLKTISRHTDYLIRWGGEEFLLVLRETSEHDACLFADRLLDTVRRAPFTLDNGASIDLRVSAGIAVLSRDKDNAKQWERGVEMADFALYQAKRAGRDCWLCMPAELSSEVLRMAPSNLQEHLASLEEKQAIHWRTSQETSD